jgi:hypothetical protein
MLVQRERRASSAVDLPHWNSSKEHRNAHGALPERCSRDCHLAELLGS